MNPQYGELSERIQQIKSRAQAILDELPPSIEEEFYASEDINLIDETQILEMGNNIIKVLKWFFSNLINFLDNPNLNLTEEHLKKLEDINSQIFAFYRGPEGVNMKMTADFDLRKYLINGDDPEEIEDPLNGFINFFDIEKINHNLKKFIKKGIKVKEIKDNTGKIVSQVPEEQINSVEIPEKFQIELDESTFKKILKLGENRLSLSQLQGNTQIFEDFVIALKKTGLIENAEDIDEEIYFYFIKPILEIVSKYFDCVRRLFSNLTSIYTKDAFENIFGGIGISFTSIGNYIENVVLTEK